MNDRLNWIGKPATRWVRNGLAALLLPYMLWLFLTARDPGLPVSFGMLVLGLITILTRGDRKRSDDATK